MSTIEALEAKNTFDAMLDRVEAGEEIVITRHGEPAVRLVRLPVVSDADRARARAALAEMDKHAKEMNLGPFNWEEWKTYRDEGRR